MQHNIFLSKELTAPDTPLRFLLDYYNGLLAVDCYHEYPDKVKEQYFDAIKVLRNTIVDRFSTVVKTINDRTSLAVNDDAAYRVVGGIVIMYDPSHDWLRAQAKLQNWMIDNWGIDDADSLTWIQENLDSHIRKAKPENDPRYPKYIDLR